MSSQCFWRYSSGSGSPAASPKNRISWGSQAAPTITARKASHRAAR